jgi:hypothetical protein
LNAGNYAVEVIDANNIKAVATITITQPDKLEPNLNVTTYPNGYNISCFNCSNGAASLAITGGVSPFSIAWSIGANANSISGLNAGNYNLMITDANGCIDSKDFNVTQPDREDWSMNGNTNSNPATQYMGTADSTDFKIKTKGVERMKFGSDGEIKFSSLIGNSSFNYLYVDQNGTVKKGPGIPPTSPSCGNPVMPWYSLLSDMSTIFLCNTNRVGIGTQSPDAYLHVNAPDYKGFLLSLDNSIYSGNAFEIKDQTNNSLFKISSDGSVFNSNIMGINTQYVPTGYTLAVEGKVIAEEIFVKLRSNWPDYVFSKDYKLMPISELKSFIDKNKHLPELKDQADVQDESGYLLGETQVLLLKKIEELTLYIIELDSQIKRQNSEILLLKNAKKEK